MDMNEMTRLRHDSAPTNVWKIRTVLEKSLLALVFVSVAVGIVLSIALASYVKSSYEVEEISNVCHSTECIHTASQLLRSIDTSMDPCSDFYSFSCGGWVNSTYNVGSMNSRFTKLNSNIMMRLAEILLEPLDNSTSIHEQKTKLFFKSCMNRRERQEMQGKLLLQDLEELGGWPLLSQDWNETGFNWTDVLIEVFRKGYDADYLLKIVVTTDLKNASKTLLMVDQPSLGIPDRIYYLLEKPLDGGMQAYKMFLLRVAVHLQPKLSMQQVMDDLEDAMSIEKELANASLSKGERKSYAEVYHMLTIDELQEIAPLIPWSYWINSLLPENVTLNDNEKLWVPNLNIVKVVQKLLEEFDNSEKRCPLANYLMYRTAADAARFLSHAYEQAYYDLANSLHNSFGSYPEPLYACVEDTEKFFHYSLESTYAKRFVDNSTRQKIELMLQDIKSSLKSQIRRADWLDSKTREKALHKVKLIRSAIAYQNQIKNDTLLDQYYENLVVDKDYFTNMKEVNRMLDLKNMEQLHKLHKRFSWDDSTSLLVANAFYSPSENSITIPEGLLQEGIYDADKPNYLHYGSLGSVVGHELMHAFDSTGSKFDGHGNYEMWWEKDTWVKFQERNKCYVKQYDKFYDPTVNLTVNGTQTLGENIADNNGLRTAYLAYGRWMKRNGGERRLLGLPYTQKQLFWISFASLWCRRQSEDSKIATIKYNEHSPADFRVNGAVSNMVEFSNDFKCKEGSPMNPTEKCSLWT